MKKMPIIMLSFAIILLIIGIIFLLSKPHTTNNNNNNNSQDEPISEDEYTPRSVLTKSLMDIANELYIKDNYDKCELDGDKCYISLKSLKEDYQYDISLFTDKKAECSIEKTRIFFVKDESSDVPFGINLEGCKYLDYQEKDTDK